MPSAWEGPLPGRGTEKTMNSRAGTWLLEQDVSPKAHGLLCGTSSSYSLHTGIGGVIDFTGAIGRATMLDGRFSPPDEAVSPQ